MLLPRMRCSSSPTFADPPLLSTMAFRIRNSATTDGQSAYEILGVHEGATDESIRTAYRSLLEKWHPDRRKDAPEAANDMA
eukprot:scaffold6656_cov149-Pinguiococcus_pyrenoidosus.AAC.2